MCSAVLAAAIGNKTRDDQSTQSFPVYTLNRFPEDFMFRLTSEESVEVSRSQFVTLKRGQNIKYLPYAFTENGVATLSNSVEQRESG